MSFPNLFESQNYFTTFVICASGYALAYTIFWRSRIWKEIDSTLRKLIAIFLGFAIEFGIVMPFYFLFDFNNAINNFGAFPFSMFNKTWLIRFILTIFFVLLAVENRSSMLKIADFLFSKIFFAFFLVCPIVLFSILSGWLAFYPDYIKYSTSNVFFYLIFGIVFSPLGLYFSLYFSKFIKSAYLEATRGNDYFYPSRRNEKEWNVKVKRRFFMFKANLKGFIKTKKGITILIFGLLIPALMVFTDANLGIFTPKVEYINGINANKEFINLSLNISMGPYSNVPNIQTNFSRDTIRC